MKSLWIVFLLLPVLLFGSTLEEAYEEIVAEWTSVRIPEIGEPAVLDIDADGTCAYTHQGETYIGLWQLKENDVAPVALFIWEERAVWKMYVHIVGNVLYLYPGLDTDTPYAFQKLY